MLRTFQFAGPPAQGPHTVTPLRTLRFVMRLMQTHTRPYIHMHTRTKSAGYAASWSTFAIKIKLKRDLQTR